MIQQQNRIVFQFVKQGNFLLMLYLHFFIVLGSSMTGLFLKGFLNLLVFCIFWVGACKILLCSSCGSTWRSHLLVFGMLCILLRFLTCVTCCSLLALPLIFTVSILCSISSLNFHLLIKTSSSLLSFYRFIHTSSYPLWKSILQGLITVW